MERIKKSLLVIYYHYLKNKLNKFFFQVIYDSNDYLCSILNDNDYVETS
jgi:hypothetical protein